MSHKSQKSQNHRPASAFPRQAIRVALPIVTVAGVLILSGWILNAAPDLDTTPLNTSKPQPRPSYLQDIRIQRMVGNEVSSWIEASTATFDFDAKQVDYENLRGSVWSTRPFPGYTPFTASKGLSRMESTGDAIFSQLRFKDILLYEDVRTAGGFFGTGEHGSMQYSMDDKDSPLKVYKSHGTGTIPDPRKPSANDTREDHSK